MPKTVLEYAVVHEICHLRHRTHDREFWGWSGPDATKACFVEQLDARHAKARELLVQRLANLHQQITAASMFQRLRGSQH